MRYTRLRSRGLWDERLQRYKGEGILSAVYNATRCPGITKGPLLTFEIKKKQKTGACLLKLV